MARKLSRVGKGQAITAEAWNAMVDEVNRLNSVSVAGGLDIHRSPQGTKISAPMRHRLWLFEITSTSPTETGDTPPVRYWEASRVRLDSSGYYVVSTPTAIRLYDPGGERLGSQLGNIDYYDGQWVWATLNQDTGRWEIIHDAFPARRRVLLQANIDSAGSTSSKVSCKLAYWNGATITSTGTAFDVYVYHAWMRHAVTDSVGYAQFHPDRGVWELESVTGISHWLEGTLNSGLLTTDATVLGTVTTHYQFGEGYYKSDHTFTATNGSTVSLKNTGKFSADAGDWFIAVMQPVEAQGYPNYVIVNAGCADGSS